MSAQTQPGRMELTTIPSRRPAAANWRVKALSPALEMPNEIAQNDWPSRGQLNEYPVGTQTAVIPMAFGDNWVTFDPCFYTVVVVLVILWLLGFIGHIGGGLIHLLLVIAVIVLLFNFISGRR